MPDLIQVNFLPDEVEVDPVLVQAAPAFTAENAGVESIEDKTNNETTLDTRLFINSEYLALLDLSLNLRIQIWCCGVS